MILEDGCRFNSNGKSGVITLFIPGYKPGTWYGMTAGHIIDKGMKATIGGKIIGTCIYSCHEKIEGTYGLMDVAMIKNKK